MEDFVVVDGDWVQFLPAFPPALVAVRMGTMSASRFSPGTDGYFTVNGKAPCVEGDERTVQVPGCTYVAGPFAIPGVGTLKVQTLAPNQFAQHARIAGRRVLLKGMQFQARFEVQTPAMQPAPLGAPVPDPTPMYMGFAVFVTTNTTKKAS